MLSAACQHRHAPARAQKKPPGSYERKLSQKQLENSFQQPPRTLNGEAHHQPCSDTELRSRGQRILRGRRQRVTCSGKSSKAEYNSDSLHLFLLSFSVSLPAKTGGGILLFFSQKSTPKSRNSFFCKKNESYIPKFEYALARKVIQLYFTHVNNMLVRQQTT